MDRNRERDARGEGRPVNARRCAGGRLVVLDAEGKNVTVYEGWAIEMIPLLRRDFPECAIVVEEPPEDYCEMSFDPTRTSN